MSRRHTLDKLILASLALAGVPAVLPVLSPVAHVAAAPAPSDLRYIVKNGDYLLGIAAKLKVGFADLLAVNNLQPASLILPGQALVVPAGGTLPQSDATPAAAGTTQSVTDPAASGAQYVVKAGDSLAAIAGKLQVKLGALLRANGLTLTSVIVPGQKLNVPAGGSLPVAAPAPGATPAVVTGDQYVIQAGDYLFGIAAKLKVTLGALLSANNLTATSLILPGQKLVIPAGGTPPATTAITASTSADTSGSAAAAVTGSPADTVVNFALAQVGKAYRFFAAGPDAYDCSGLVVAAYAQIGMGVIHQSRAQSMLGTPVDWRNEAIRPGDLVFTARGGSDPTLVGHVGIAVNSTHWVDAVSPGQGVKSGWIPADSKILAVRRLING